MSGPEALRAAGRALQHWQRRQEVNAHNLANVDTTGFMARRAYTALTPGGVPDVATVVDRRAGPLRETGAPLDLAVGGEGYLVVQSATGEEYVRSGSFALDGYGRVIDERGRPLLVEGGELLVPPGPIQIDGTGHVTVAGDVIGRLRIETGPVVVDAGGRIVPEASGRAGPQVGGVPLRSSPPESAGGDPAVLVRQGYLADSNVGALDALIEMTTIQRAFQAVQGSLRILDETLETAVNRLGRVG